jgi:hypothetical protein
MGQQISKDLLKQIGTLVLVAIFGLSSLFLKSAYSMDRFKDRVKVMVHEGQIAVGKNRFKAKKIVVPELPPEEARKRKLEFQKRQREKWNGRPDSLNADNPPQAGLKRIGTQRNGEMPPQISPISPVSPMDIPHVRKDLPHKLSPISPVSPINVPHLPRDTSVR